MKTLLWSFGSGADGVVPNGGLIELNDGSFYGTTAGGGAYGNGTIFRITSSGAESVLWSFRADGDGNFPIGELLQASDGNVYGMTRFGGANNAGTVFRIAPSGMETVVISFSCTNGGPCAPTRNGLIEVEEGVLYGLTSEGGTNGFGSIFKLTFGGALTTLASFAGDNGAWLLGNLVKAKDGDFYGVAGAGDEAQLGNVFRMTPDGQLSTLLVFRGDGDEGDAPSGGLIQASDGNLYGVTSSSGGTLFQITPSGIETILSSFPSDGSSAHWPSGNLVQGKDGGLYGVTDDGGASGNGSVFQFK